MKRNYRKTSAAYGHPAYPPVGEVAAVYEGDLRDLIECRERAGKPAPRGRAGGRLGRVRDAVWPFLR
jgi:hypothetical protein